MHGVVGEDARLHFHRKRQEALGRMSGVVAASRAMVSPDAVPSIASQYTLACAFRVGGDYRSIKADICTKHKVTTEQLEGQSRRAVFVNARREFWSRLSKELGWSLTKIGNKVKRDHTSILWGIRQYDASLQGKRWTFVMTPEGQRKDLILNIKEKRP